MNAREPKANDTRRPIAPLESELEKRLSAYAGAAVAAGVGLLALTTAAEAKIVYTPANIDIPVGVPVPLDLDHDGTADFSFLNASSQGPEGQFIALLSAVAKSQGNQIWARGATNSGGLFAAALPPGFTVGQNKSYFQIRRRGLMALDWGGVYGSPFYYGQWAGSTQRRYLGLKFMIDGQIHYGWARLNATGFYSNPIQATLTGYAYETIPNKPIIAGKTKGPDVITWEPATLGHLAQGASGISAWREKK
jgi:hypothetical protein